MFIEECSFEEECLLMTPLIPQLGCCTWKFVFKNFPLFPSVSVIHLISSSSRFLLSPARKFSFKVAAQYSLFPSGVVPLISPVELSYMRCLVSSCPDELFDLDFYSKSSPISPMGIPGEYHPGRLLLWVCIPSRYLQVNIARVVCRCSPIIDKDWLLPMKSKESFSL